MKNGVVEEHSEEVHTSSTHVRSVYAANLLPQHPREGLLARLAVVYIDEEGGESIQKVSSISFPSSLLTIMFHSYAII